MEMKENFFGSNQCPFSCSGMIRRITIYEVTSTKTIGSIYQILDRWQKERLNRRGYGFLNKQQMEYIYGAQTYNKTYMQIDVSEYNRWTDAEKQEILYDWLLFGRRRRYRLVLRPFQSNVKQESTPLGYFKSITILLILSNERSCNRNQPDALKPSMVFQSAIFFAFLVALSLSLLAIFIWMFSNLYRCKVSGKEIGTKL